jgi:hydroxymethylpyrimidine/phosphomethylpyrimidine kinase
MNAANGRPPVVLAISGHDPTGAAGVQADIEAVARCGARCATLITATTAQNTGTFDSLFPRSVAELRRAADLLLEDMHFDACKIGLIGSAAVAAFIAELLPKIGRIPVVIDPVLRAGTGEPVADERLVEAYRRKLLGRCTIATPNCAEARRLGEHEDAQEAARRMLETGAANVLVTGADEATPAVVNVLYRSSGDPVRYEYDRIPGRFHGSGCTLSAALAAYLARGHGIESAVGLAQAYTHRALRGAFAFGRGQLHPDRFVPPPDSTAK